MAKVFTKLLVAGAALGAVWYFVNKNKEQAGEKAEGEASEGGYVTIDRQALKDKAGNVIDKVAPIIDDTCGKISPFIGAAKEKVNSILNKNDKTDSEDITDDVEDAVNDAANDATEKAEEFFDEGEEEETLD